MLQILVNAARAIRVIGFIIVKKVIKFRTRVVRSMEDEGLLG